jgi:hypothetical protein
MLLIASGFALAGLIVAVVLPMCDLGRGYASQETTWP